MQETILAPARTISEFYVRIRNTEQKQGFIPQLHLCNEEEIARQVNELIDKKLLNLHNHYTIHLFRYYQKN